MKTILAVALLIVGFAYAVGAGHPTLGTVDQCCEPPTWDYEFVTVVGVQEVVSGGGILHGVWVTPVTWPMDVHIFDGPPEDGVQIGRIKTIRAGTAGYMVTPVFMELDVQFANGLFIQTGVNPPEETMTILYKQ